MIAIDWSKLTRLTVVDDEGRHLERWNLKIVPSVQDDGRTLKLFIEQAHKPPASDKPEVA